MAEARNATAELYWSLRQIYRTIHGLAAEDQQSLWRLVKTSNAIVCDSSGRFVGVADPGGYRFQGRIWPLQDYHRARQSELVRLGLRPRSELAITGKVYDGLDLDEEVIQRGGKMPLLGRESDFDEQSAYYDFPESPADSKQSLAYDLHRLADEATVLAFATRCVTEQIASLKAAVEEALRQLAAVPSSLQQQLNQLANRPWAAFLRKSALDRLGFWPSSLLSPPSLPTTEEQLLRLGIAHPPSDGWREIGTTVQEHLRDLYALRVEIDAVTDSQAVQHSHGGLLTGLPLASAAESQPENRSDDMCDFSEVEHTVLAALGELSAEDKFRHRTYDEIEGRSGCQREQISNALKKFDGLGLTVRNGRRSPRLSERGLVVHAQMSVPD